MVLLEKKNCSLLNSLAYSGFQIVRMTREWQACENMSVWSGKRGRCIAISSPFIFVFALSQFCRPDYLGSWNRLHQWSLCVFFIPFVYLLIKKKNGWITVLILASPLDGEWGPWTPWTQCSQTCGISGGSILSRTRLCNQPPPMNGGKPCAGNDTESAKSCLTPCPG